MKPRNLPKVTFFRERAGSGHETTVEAVDASLSKLSMFLHPPICTCLTYEYTYKHDGKQKCGHIGEGATFTTIKYLDININMQK